MRMRGFTMIELVMALLIVSVLAVVTGPLLATSIQAIIMHLKIANMEESADFAVTRMSREIRRLGNDESVLTANPDEILFVDRDGLQIRYRLVGTSLMRQEDENTEYELADKLSNLSFTYYDGGGNVLSSPLVAPSSTDIRRIAVRLSFQDDPYPYQTQTQIRPRNLRHESELFL